MTKKTKPHKDFTIGQIYPINGKKKETMRPIHELLQILLDNKKLFIEKKCSGLCILTAVLYYNYGLITAFEYNTLVNYFYNNKPKSKWLNDNTKHQKEWNSTKIDVSLLSQFHFEPFLWASRARYLHHHIKKTKTN